MLDFFEFLHIFRGFLPDGWLATELPFLHFGLDDDLFRRFCYVGVLVGVLVGVFVGVFVGVWVTAQGLYEGFYKLFGFDYDIFPERMNKGWAIEMILKPRLLS